jgi:hypothetical protein
MPTTSTTKSPTVPTGPAHPPPGPPDGLPTHIVPEADQGFGESHGYGPGHGGPSGPGDVPSKDPATVVPADDTSEKDDP